MLWSSCRALCGVRFKESDRPRLLGRELLCPSNGDGRFVSHDTSAIRRSRYLFEVGAHTSCLFTFPTTAICRPYDEGLRPVTVRLVV